MLDHLHHTTKTVTTAVQATYKDDGDDEEENDSHRRQHSKKNLESRPPIPQPSKDEWNHRSHRVEDEANHLLGEDEEVDVDHHHHKNEATNTNIHHGCCCWLEPAYARGTSVVVRTGNAHCGERSRWCILGPHWPLMTMTISSLSVLAISTMYIVWTNPEV